MGTGDAGPGGSVRVPVPGKSGTRRWERPRFWQIGDGSGGADHWQETPGVPPAGPRFPVPAESGNGRGDFPIPDSGRLGVGNRGFPPRFPAKSGIGGTGIGGFTVTSGSGRHPSSAGPSQFKKDSEGGGRPESAFEGLTGKAVDIQPRMVPAQCAHTRRVFPISRFAANRETGDFPIPDSCRVGNRGFPPRFPAKSGMGGTGIGDFRVCGGASPKSSGKSGTGRPRAPGGGLQGRIFRVATECTE
jgi:hypothetical protein